MSKPERNVKSSFMIKLSDETVQKLTEEVKQSKIEILGSSSDFDKQETNKECVNTENQNIQRNISEVVKVGPEISADPFSKDDPPTDRLKEIITTVPIECDKKLVSTSEPVSTSSTWSDYSAHVTYEGEKAIYTDPSTQQKYLWNNLTNAWDCKDQNSDVSGRVYSFENDTHVYTDADGSKFFYDQEKKAWIPKVDDDFLAMYQLSYGFIDNSKSQDDHKVDNKIKGEKPQEIHGGVKRKNEPQWFEPSEETNTKVYVSNLPLDIVEEEFVNLMQKCGLVERDLNTHKMKVKLYIDKESNSFKGDALCTYIKKESVDLALNLLDGSEYKGHKIKVERAHFQLKGEYNPALKPKKKKKKEIEKLKKMKEKLFDWRPEKFIGERSKHERVVIVKNLFHPTDFDQEVQLILDYQQDLREECSKCGEVRKVIIYDRHPDGVAQITMKDPDQADAVIQLINGRWFGKKQITAEIWDGKTKYKIGETDADLHKRIDKWDEFIEGKDEKDSNNKVLEDENKAHVGEMQSNTVEGEATKNIEEHNNDQEAECSREIVSNIEEGCMKTD